MTKKYCIIYLIKKGNYVDCENLFLKYINDSKY